MAIINDIMIIVKSSVEPKEFQLNMFTINPLKLKMILFDYLQFSSFKTFTICVESILNIFEKLGIL